jgi:hypothetical protein
VHDFLEQSCTVAESLRQASALKKLKEMVAYSAEFSSVSEACIRKNAPDPVVASVFEHLPAA